MTAAEQMVTIDLAEAWDQADIALEHALKAAYSLGHGVEVDALANLLAQLRTALPRGLHLAAAEARDALEASIPY